MLLPWPLTETYSLNYVVIYYIKQGIFEDLSEINLNNQIIILFSLQENIKILKNLIPSKFQTLSFF